MDVKYSTGVGEGYMASALGLGHVECMNMDIARVFLVERKGANDEEAMGRIREIVNGRWTSCSL